MYYFKETFVFLLVLLFISSCDLIRKTDTTEPFECKIEIDSNSIELVESSTHEFKVNIQSNQPGKCSKEVSWEVTNPEVGSIDQTGKFTARTGGETEILACSKQNPEECDNSSVKIYNLDIAFMGRNHNGNVDIYVTSSKKKGAKKRITTDKEEDSTPIVWTKDGKNILFGSYRTEGPSIFITGIQQDKKHGPENLTRNIDFAYNPDLSPDGDYLVMQARKTKDDYMEIHKFNLETKELNRLTFEKVKSGAKPNNPDWSPDGEKIAYSSARNGGEIYVMDADGSNKRNITQTPNKGEVSPSWSPDGEKIAYITNKDIYVMDADGSNKVKIGYGSAPEWTPSGRIVFGDAGTGLYIMDSDGSNVETISAKSDFEDLEYVGYPSWRPETD